MTLQGLGGGSSATTPMTSLKDPFKRMYITLSSSSGSFQFQLIPLLAGHLSLT